MGRVLVRDQYSAEHWIDEASLAYAPWRDCEVIRRAPEPGDEPASNVTTEPPASDNKPAPVVAQPVDDKRRPTADSKATAQPAKPAAE